MPEQENTETTNTEDSNNVIRALEQEVDIFRYIAILWHRKWWICAVSIMFGVLALLSVINKPDIYESITRVDIVYEGNPGGVDPDNIRTPEAVGLLEHGFVIRASKDNYTQSVIARLRSRKFTRYFIEQNDIYRLLFPNQWDEKNQVYTAEFDRGLAYKAFVEEHRSIWQDPETEIVHIGIRHTDPLLATSLANAYVANFNQYMRNKALAEVQTKQAFLQELLVETKIVEMEQMIFRLLEAQTAAAMLVKGRADFALEVLDPAVRPYDRYSPKRKKRVLLGVIAGALLASIGLIVMAMLLEMRRKFSVYYARYKEQQ